MHGLKMNRVDPSGNTCCPHLEGKTFSRPTKKQEEHAWRAASLRLCSPEWGGSNIRPEATGYGAVFFAEEVLKAKGEDIKVRRVCGRVCGASSLSFPSLLSSVR